MSENWEDEGLNDIESEIETVGGEDKWDGEAGPTWEEDEEDIPEGEAGGGGSARVKEDAELSHELRLEVLDSILAMVLGSLARRPTTPEPLHFEMLAGIHAAVKKKWIDEFQGLSLQNRDWKIAMPLAVVPDGKVVAAKAAAAL